MKSLSTVAAIPLFLFSSLGFSSSLHYSMVVDAGSSGSRLYIYQYDTSTGVPTITKLYSSDNLKPGLSTFADKPAEVQNYLKPLQNGAKDYLKGHSLDPKEVPISFLGTAGMRLVEDKQKERAIYQEVRNV